MKIISTYKGDNPFFVKPKGAVLATGPAIKVINRNEKCAEHEKLSIDEIISLFDSFVKDMAQPNKKIDLEDVKNLKAFKKVYEKYTKTVDNSFLYKIFKILASVFSFFKTKVDRKYQYQNLIQQSKALNISTSDVVSLVMQPEEIAVQTSLNLKNEDVDNQFKKDILRRNSTCQMKVCFQGKRITLRSKKEKENDENYLKYCEAQFKKLSLKGSELLLLKASLTQGMMTFVALAEIKIMQELQEFNIIEEIKENPFNDHQNRTFDITISLNEDKAELRCMIGCDITVFPNKPNAYNLRVVKTSRVFYDDRHEIVESNANILRIEREPSLVVKIFSFIKSFFNF